MQKLYAIYDIKAMLIIGQILVMHRHDAAAIRMFIDSCTQRGSQVAQHPEDYILVCMGEFDELEQKITPQLRTVIEGSAWLALQETATTGASAAPAASDSLGG